MTVETIITSGNKVLKRDFSGPEPHRLYKWFPVISGKAFKPSRYDPFAFSPIHFLCIYINKLWIITRGDHLHTSHTHTLWFAILRPSSRLLFLLSIIFLHLEL